MWQFRKSTQVPLPKINVKVDCQGRMSRSKVKFRGQGSSSTFKGQGSRSTFKGQSSRSKVGVKVTYRYQNWTISQIDAGAITKNQCQGRMSRSNVKVEGQGQRSRSRSGVKVKGQRSNVGVKVTCRYQNVTISQIETGAITLKMWPFDL